MLTGIPGAGPAPLAIPADRPDGALLWSGRGIVTRRPDERRGIRQEPPRVLPLHTKIDKIVSKFDYVSTVRILLVKCVKKRRVLVSYVTAWSRRGTIVCGVSGRRTGACQGRAGVA